MTPKWIDRWLTPLDSLVSRFWRNPDAELARYYAASIRKELDRMNVSYHYRAKRLNGREADAADLIEFMSPLVVTPSAVKLKVDTRPGRLPHGISKSDICRPDITETLALTLGREVIVSDENPRDGLFLEISNSSTVSGIPRQVWHDDVNLPIDASPLSFLVGISRRGPVITDLETMPHFLIGGATRQGKSIHLWHIIATLAMRNSPQSLRLALLDLKDGVMFFSFRNLPHLMYPVVETPDQCKTALTDLVEEMQRRNKVIRDHGQTTRSNFNALANVEPMPAIVVVIDELASLTMTKDADLKNAERKLVLLLRQGASAGIHVVMATQNPRVEVVNSDIRANITEALAFACAKRTHSDIIIGASGAESIKVKGRALFKYGAQITELQTPRMGERPGKHSVYEAISAIVQKWETPPPIPQAPSDDQLKQELVNYALNNFGGIFRVPKLFQVFKGRVAQKRLQEIAQELEKAGVLSPGSPRNPRKVIRSNCIESIQDDQAKPASEALSDEEAAQLFKAQAKQPEVIDV